MARYTVVGASGYLGGSIAAHLSEQGHEVVSVYRTQPDDPRNISDTFLMSLEVDGTDTKFAEKVVDTDPDFVIYCISLDHFKSEKNITQSLAVNVAPLLELGREIAQRRSSCTLIFFSTMQVYGKLEDREVVEETREARPQNFYALTHYLCEEGLAMLRFSQGLRATSLRLSNGYGPSAFPSANFSWLALNDFCRSAVRDGVISLKSDGSAARDFIFVDDIARVISGFSQLSDDLAPKYNLASGYTVSIANAAEKVARVCEERFGLPARVAFPPGVEPNADAFQETAFRVEASKLRTTLGFGPSVELEDGIEKTIQYYKGI